MGSVIILGLVILILWNILSDIYSKMNDLEKRVETLSGEPAKEEVSFQAVQNDNTMDMVKEDSISDTQEIKLSIESNGDSNNYESQEKNTITRSLEPSIVSKFIEWFKVDWPMKVGGLLFILGIGRFIGLAINNNWIPPEVRIGLSVLLGFVAIGIGCHQTPKQPIQGSYLISIGSAIYVIALFLGFKLFGFFGTTLTLSLIALQYFWMAYLSYYYKNHWLNDVGLAFSMISPFFFHDGSISIVWLFSYVSIHLLGNTIIGFINKRARSRFANIVYLIIYMASGYIDTTYKMSLYPIITIVSGLLGAFSFVEIYFHTISKDKLKDISYRTITISGLITLVYISSLYTIYTNLVNIIMTCWFLVYGLLRYIHSMQKPQNIYSGIIGMLSVIFIGSIAYNNFSGASLLLTSVIIYGAVMANIIVITKDEGISSLTSSLGFIPLYLGLYQFILHRGALSISYIVAVYTASTIMIILALLAKHSFTKDKTTLAIAFGLIGLGLFYHGLCINFDGYLRIVILVTTGFILCLLGYITKLSRINYSSLIFVYFGLPLIYILGYGFSKDIKLFGCASLMLLALGIVTALAQKLPSSEEEGDNNIIMGLYILIISIIHLGVIYIIDIEWYTLAYTILALLLYGIGTRAFQIFGNDKTVYSILLIIPLFASIGLWEASHFTQTISTIIVSASFLWMRWDNNETTSQNPLGYIYYFFSLLYLSMSITSATQDLLDKQEIIVLLIIVFSILGLGFYIAGKKFDHTQHRIIGTALLLSLIGRIFLVELRQLNTAMRIIVCLVVGSLMIGSGFIGNKKNKLSNISNNNK